MGEAKRRRDRMTDYEKRMVDLERKLADEGKLIEAGWIGLRKVWLTEAADAELILYCRMAFMAGCAHLFPAIIGVLEDGDDEPTKKDMERITKIYEEITRFNDELKAALQQPEGSA